MRPSAIHRRVCKTYSGIGLRSNPQRTIKAQSKRARKASSIRGNYIFLICRVWPGSLSYPAPVLRNSYWLHVQGPGVGSPPGFDPSLRGHPASGPIRKLRQLQLRLPHQTVRAGDRAAAQRSESPFCALRPSWSCGWLLLLSLFPLSEWGYRENTGLNVVYWQFMCLSE